VTEPGDQDLGSPALSGTVAILFGPPGSGKGTQSGWIAGNFNLVHVSTGDLLRKEITEGTALGRQVEPIMASGELVPDDLIVRVIEHRMRQEDARGGILLDGFPRTLPQAEALDRMLVRGGTHAHYAPSGHLIYVAAGTLRAIPFDLNHREARGGEGRRQRGDRPHPLRGLRSRDRAGAGVLRRLRCQRPAHQRRR